MSSNHDIVDISDKFNKYIKILTSTIDVSMSNKKNSDESEYFNKLKKKIFLLIGHEPLVILQQCGPYLYDFREEIFNNDINKLLNESDIDNVSEYLNNEVQDENIKDTSNIKKLIHCLKTVWFGYTPDEQKKIVKLLKHLISEYSKYLLIKS
jgi:hypothetical protein